MIKDKYIWKDNPVLFNSLLRDDNDKFVEKLFNYSSLIDITNINNESLLHYSCFYGMIDKYYALINMGAKVQKTINDNNLLHYASLSGKDDFLIVELIKLGIKPTDKNLYGQTSLHFASNERICHYLNLWCLRNNVNIIQLQDKMNNSVAHYSYSIKNKGSSNYWVKNHEKLKISKNLNGLLFNEVEKVDHPEICLIK